MVKYNTEKIRQNNKNLDIFIGEKLKQRRVLLGMSQDKLASCLGITFQQIQKYEKGVNRISASMLYTIANVLSIDLQYFIDGYENETQARRSLNEKSTLTYDADTDDLNTKESTKVLKAYHSIADQKIRKKALDLLKSISNSSK